MRRLLPCALLSLAACSSSDGGASEPKQTANSSGADSGAGPVADSGPDDPVADAKLGTVDTSLLGASCKSHVDCSDTQNCISFGAAPSLGAHCVATANESGVLVCPAGMVGGSSPEADPLVYVCSKY